jgi:transcriptional/translational regulatory protein YebC/TACO1
MIVYLVMNFMKCIRLPINKVSLKGEENQNMVKFLETLDDEDDVQNVYTNVNFED